MITEEMVENAKKVLSEAGYFTDSLWHVADVTSVCKCDYGDAREVLNGALGNDETVSQINYAIKDIASAMDLPLYKDDFFEISGFFKDDGAEFSGLLVHAYDDCPSDMDEEDVFLFGMDESAIQKEIELGDETGADFVITSYTKASVDW